MKDTFQFWLRMLDQTAQLNGYNCASVVAVTGIEMWRPYYNKGLAPDKALEQAEHDNTDAQAEINGEIE